MMKKIYTLAIVLLVLGVSSCKLGKHYSGTPAVDPENIGRKQRPDDRCGQSERIDGTPSYR